VHPVSNIYELQPRFSRLFQGLEAAFGTGKGQWVKRPPRPEDFIEHLEGKGPGIGIAPLRPDNTVLFAAIDLDEPDFDAAREMQNYLPGPSFIERSRSGNAHVWVFFSDPVEAWIPMGVLREATLAAGKKHVEVFPKNHNFAQVRLGNYINLPYHGESRFIYNNGMTGMELSLEAFLSAAERSLNDPKEWETRATVWLQLSPPDHRQATSEFGTQERLHICAEALVSGETPPPAPGHRSNVFFMLAKCLTNWTGCDSAEALEYMRQVNNSSPDPIPDSEVSRILGNAERGRFTSTGCDDPVVEPYTHPDCPILKRSR
jgi:TOTE conflict system primase-like protein